MTIARAKVFDPYKAAAYHCHTRCVRGARLCGRDPFTGHSREHRRGWIEARMLDLCESFAVGLYAWAVMHNHYHLVLVVDPCLPAQWSDEEVARRWCRLTQIPGARRDPRKVQTAESALLADPESLAERRRRLGSLSWFMRYMNEGIARCANREDGCKGRFWESRYGSQNLLDDTAMLAGMSYADLNPIRAGMADELADSRYTAVHRRLTALTTGEMEADTPLMPLAGTVTNFAPAITVGQYLDLLDWSGRQQRPGKASLDPDVPSALVSALASTSVAPRAWLRISAGLQQVFASAVGSFTSLQAHAARTERAWLRGMGFCRQLTRSSADAAAVGRLTRAGPQ